MSQGSSANAFGLLMRPAAARRRPPPRPAAQHDQQLFPGVVEVVDDEVPRIELADGRAEPGPLRRPWQPFVPPAAARPVLALLAPLLAPDVGIARAETMTDKEDIFCHVWAVSSETCARPASSRSCSCFRRAAV